MARFHDRPFDEATKLKLELFRGYIREWLPVFLVKSSARKPSIRQVNIFDFFAGPGHDASGNPGSPTVIMQELNDFCDERRGLLANDMCLQVYFNDIDSGIIADLKHALEDVQRPSICRAPQYMCLPFEEALGKCWAEIRNRESANLVIMDQCGVTYVTPDTVHKLAECSATDILFFISTSYIRRFSREPAISDKLDIDPSQIEGGEYKHIHRQICDSYRSELEDINYYLAPFSIKKGSNIYGVIFGSGSLHGLEKFLKVCWKTDKITGEANYNIDGDFARDQPALLPDLNRIKKVELFKRELIDFISEECPNNKNVYEFCLTKGFLPKDFTDFLKALQSNDTLNVTCLKTDEPARKGAFYLTWDNFKQPPRVRYELGSKI